MLTIGCVCIFRVRFRSVDVKDIHGMEEGTSIGRRSTIMHSSVSRTGMFRVGLQVAASISPSVVVRLSWEFEMDDVALWPALAEGVGFCWSRGPPKCDSWKGDWPASSITGLCGTSFCLSSRDTTVVGFSERESPPEMQRTRVYLFVRLHLLFWMTACGQRKVIKNHRTQGNKTCLLCSQHCGLVQFGAGTCGATSTNMV